MNTYVAFLRAVNVGGKNRVPMAPLRDALTGAGLQDVETVLQSGNVVLRSGRSSEGVARIVGSAIEENFGLRIGVVVRSAVELIAVAATNPFLDEDPDRDPKLVYVAFLSTEPSAAAAAKLDTDRSPPDAFAIEGREVYPQLPGRVRPLAAHARLSREDARRHGHCAKLAHGTAAGDPAPVLGTSADS